MVRSPFVETWHGHEAELKRVRDEEFAKYEQAIAAGDYDIGNLTVGETIGLVHDVPTPREVIERTIEEAEARIRKFAAIPVAA